MSVRSSRARSRGGFLYESRLSETGEGRARGSRDCSMSQVKVGARLARKATYLLTSRLPAINTRGSAVLGEGFAAVPSAARKDTDPKSPPTSPPVAWTYCWTKCC